MSLTEPKVPMRTTRNSAKRCSKPVPITALELQCNSRLRNKTGGTTNPDYSLFFQDFDSLSEEEEKVRKRKFNLPTINLLNIGDQKKITKGSSPNQKN